MHIALPSTPHHTTMESRAQSAMWTNAHPQNTTSKTHTSPTPPDLALFCLSQSPETMQLTDLRTNAHPHSAPSHTTSCTLPPPTAGDFVDTDARSHNTQTLGRSKGPRGKPDRSRLLTVNDRQKGAHGLTRGTEIHRMPHEAIPHTPMLYTSPIGVLPQTPLLHLQTHPSAPPMCHPRHLVRCMHTHSQHLHPRPATYTQHSMSHPWEPEDSRPPTPHVCSMRNIPDSPSGE